MKSKILILVTLFLSLNLYCDYFEITVGPNVHIYDYTSISNAISYIQTINGFAESEFDLLVYPDYLGAHQPLVTTYYEDIDVPRTTISIIAVEGPDYTIINTGIDGHTGFHILSDGGNQQGVPFPYMAHIEGFTIMRDGYNTSTQFASAIETYSRNTYIKNCKFLQGNNRSFNNSIYSITDGYKGKWAIQVDSCSFNNSCFDSSYAILMEAVNSSYRGYNALIKNNSILNCGNGVKTSDVEVVKIFDNNILNDSFSSYTTCGIEFNQIIEPFFQSFVENNTIENFDLGIKTSAAARIPLINDNIINNNISAIEVYGLGADIFRNLIFDNSLSEPVTALFLDCDTVSFFQNTLVTNENNSVAIDCNNNEDLFHRDYIYNTIFWGFSTIIDNFAGNNLEIDYCCLDITPPFNGSNNIINPVNQVFSDSATEDYSLYWNTNLNDSSPCINTGDIDPDMDGRDYREDEDNRDPDNSRLDIGYTPHLFTDRDFKYYNDGWHWDSFPRLDRDVNGEENIVSILNDIIPFNFSNFWLSYENGTPLYYSNNQWNPSTGYDINSTSLYKSKLAPEESRELAVLGTRLSESHTLSETINANTWYWIGYWLPEDQNIYDALYDYWNDVSAVFAEDWAFSKQQRGIEIGGPIPPIWSPGGKTMEYGKGYIVKFGQSIPNFHWSNGGSPAKAVKSSTPVNFSFEELPEYEPIDILGINCREDIIEIGVFENETCVGAVVVDDFPVQLLAYTGQEECDSLSFRIITSTRNQIYISNYSVFDNQTGNFQSQSITPCANEYSIVTLGEPEESVIPNKISLSSNYPNPFNPKTTISFSSYGNQKLTLTIYNLKGQRIRELFNKTIDDGEHTYIWDSKDDSGLPVSSGVYFYKLESKDSSCIKKMLLMK